MPPDDPAPTPREEALRRGIGSYERHIFICTGPDCCTPEEGADAWTHLKSAVAKLNGSKDRGRIYRTKVGCLRICTQGPTAVIYPEGTWYANLTPENLDRVIDQDLAHGAPVEDLVIGANPLPPHEHPPRP